MGKEVFTATFYRVVHSQMALLKKEVDSSLQKSDIRSQKQIMTSELAMGNDTIN